MWNPVIFSIYFRQINVLKYLVKEVKVNLRIAFDRPDSINEHALDSQFMKQYLN